MAKLKVICFLVLFWKCYVIDCSVSTDFGKRLPQKLMRNYMQSNPKTIYSVVVDSPVLKQGGVLHSETYKSHARHRRQAGVDTTHFAHEFDLKDSHYQLLVHWAGAGSDTIIALARNRTSRPTGTVYISNDYGAKFKEQTLNLNDTLPAVIDQFFVSPVVNTHYIFVDVVNKFIFTTTNTGEILYKTAVPFVPKLISFHPSQRDYLLGYDENDPEKRLWKSSDFGDSWSLFKSRVESFYWGSADYSDDPNALYIHKQTAANSDVIKVDFTSDYGEQRLTTHVDSFQVHENYMFATRNISNKLELWVSYNRGPFRRAQFPNNLTHNDYYIVDASEGQVFVCVNHDNDSTSNSNLYISEAQGLIYSLSLENVFYFNPKGVNKASWLKYVAEKSFVDVHKVEGLRGIYIANKFYNSSSIENNMQKSVITYNKGASWGSIEPPQNDSLGQATNCSYYSWYDYYYGYRSGSCSLHLTQRLNMYDPGSRTNPILSKKSAPGLIIGTGKLNSSLDADTDYNVYLSRDGGLEWNEVLKGPYHYAFGDHGGLILAVKQYILTGEFVYSWDEGQTWLTYKFSDEKLHIYGILTEPGEQTTIFFLFGSKPGPHSWITVKVDLKGVFNHKNCQDNDYKQWSPTDNPRVDCLMGRKMVYERRRENSLCLNKRNYDRPLSSENCTCSSDDFECDIGWMKTYSWSSTCEPDARHNHTTHHIPSHCPEGSTYTRTKGYRKIAGNTCQGGIEYTRMPDVLMCPVGVKEDFILYSTRTSIHRYMFSSGVDEVLPLTGVKDIVALDYDYHNNCLYWADTELDIIQRLCMSQNDSTNDRQETLIGETLDSVEGLAYDWMSHNIYWVDAGHTPKIEVARADGTHRRLLIKGKVGNETILKKPRAIALAPWHGVMFWTDWGDEEPAIMRASMDGFNITTIASSYWVHWPNGVAVDSHREKIYWTDAYLDKIYTCDFNGTNKEVLLSYSNLVQHPYAITIYKDQVYWSDWDNHAILMADKYSGNLAGPFISNLTRVTDIKVLHAASQQGQSPCSVHNGQCTSLCTERMLLGFNVGRTCLCSDMFKTRHHISITNVNGTYNERCSCVNNLPLDSAGFCAATSNKSCGDSEFACHNQNRCVPLTWKCDRDNDCGDFSDELDCTYHPCEESEFRCGNGRCIPDRWKCDRDDDCGDQSDEAQSLCSGGFPTCSSEQFECQNGRCISALWHCDGDDDCHDYSDEANCHFNRTTVPFIGTCATNQFTCVSGSVHCINATWKCDGASDCDDGSDEFHCHSNTSAGCGHGQWRCGNGHCISEVLRCDHINDCLNGEDEKNCTYPVTDFPGTYSPVSCDSWMSLSCGDGTCVSLWDACDGYKDCPQGQDEFGCVTAAPTDVYTTRPYTPRTCSEEEYQCMGGSCIFMAWICDQENDCPHGDDEKNCNSSVTCGPNEIKCSISGGCIPVSAQCDGTNDCTDGTDEWGCKTMVITSVSPVSTCAHYEFDCGFGHCILPRELCDGRIQCWDGRDENETLCKDRTGQYYVQDYDVVVNSGGQNIMIHWSRIMPQLNANYNVKVMVKPGDSPWVNRTVNSSVHDVTFPLQNSNFQYTAVVIYRGIESPMAPIKTFSSELPSPENLILTATDKPSIIVQWDMHQPEQVNQFVVHYKEAGGSNSAMSMYVSVEQHTHYQVELTMVSTGKTYNVYVSAKLNSGDETRVKFQSLAFNGTGCSVSIEDIDTVTDTSMNVKYSVKLHGDGSINSVHLVLTSQETLSRLFFDHTNGETSTKKEGKYTGHITASNLSPGVQYRLQLDVFDSKNPNQPCESKIIFKSTTGSPVAKPAITHVGLGADQDAIKLTWINHPNVTSKDMKYTIYYTTQSVHFEDVNQTMGYDGVKTVPHIGTQWYEVRDLKPCEEYFFKVQVTEPHRGQPSAVSNGRTSFDERSPPKNVEVTVVQPSSGDSTKRDLKVSFDAACWEQHYFDKTVEYLILIEDVVQGQMNAKSITLQQAAHMQATVSDVVRSAQYNIYVKSSAAQSKKSEVVHIHVDPYAAPGEFKVIPLYLEEYSGASLTWSRPTDLPAALNVSYQVYHAVCPDRDVEPQYSVMATTRTIYYSIDHLEPSKKHCFKVTTLLQSNYLGEFTNMESLPAFPLDKLSGHGNTPGNSAASSSDSSQMNVATIVGIVVPCVLVFLVVCTILGIYIYRHRRLQQSFLSYARSHYDTQTDRTTFSSAEEEEPMIKGFADDEPLVLG